MKRAHRKSGRPHQKGAVAVELAMMLPLLTVLFAGVVDVGLLLREHQIMQNAAREGARFSALPKNRVTPQNPGATLARIQQRVVDYLAEENIQAAPESVAVVQDREMIVGGVKVTGSEITVSYARDPLIGLVSPGPVTLQARSVFRNLY